VIALGPDRWANAGFWSSESNVLIDIQLGLDGGASFTSLIQGFVDNVSINPVNRVVRLSGRDLTAALVEARTQEAFSNRTSSEIATIFANRHELIPRVVITNTPVGRFYQSDHENLTLDRFSGAITEWDLLVYLARQEGYDIFVSGRTLCFQPTAQGSGIDQILYPSDMIDIKLERALTLARDIQITVQSWNSLQQIAFTESVISTISPGSSSSASSGRNLTQQYVLIRPNLTPDKALAIAQQRLSELSRHERVVEFSMPGELALTPRSTIQLDGTGTDFDQLYFIESVDRRFNLRTGFIQQVRASNSSPRTESALNAMD
jgi:phage protein D